MNNQFSFDFSSLLKVCQAKPIRIFLQLGIGFSLILFGEIGFFMGFDKYSVVGCSLANQMNSPISIDNCYVNNFELTTCINNKYNTGSNYSLNFTIGTLGTTDDKLSGILIAISVLFFVCAQVLFQFAHYFQFQKRKRIQDILAGSGVFVDGNKKHEKKLTFYFLIIGIVYILTKMGWVIFRNKEYNLLDCNGDIYKVGFKSTLTASLSPLLMGSFPYLIFPLIYVGGWMNYLSDIDFKRMCEHLSSDSFNEVKNLSIFDVEKYNKLIDSIIFNRYHNDSKLKLFLRTNTFSFFTTPTSEIVEIILTHKISSPQDFTPILLKDNNNKISFISSDENNMKQKLIDHNNNNI